MGQWNNSGHLESKEGTLDTNYWQQRLHIASIKGHHYNTLLESLETMAVQFGHYGLFSLHATDSSSEPLPASTCFDFMTAMAEQVKAIGGASSFKPLDQGVLV